MNDAGIPIAQRPLVVVCGPIAAQGRPAAGGYQRGNRRLIGLLEELGCEVAELAYPEGVRTLAQKARAYAARFLGMAGYLLTKTPRPAAMHITPLCRHFLPAEYFICSLAKLRGIRLTIDLRAGAQIAHYETGSPIYRSMYRRFLRLADVLSFEGEAYADFVRGIAPATPLYYLPNFLSAEEVPQAVAPRGSGGPKLAYVGLVSEAKGAYHAAKALEALQRRLPDASLHLIGNVDEECRRKIAALACRNLVFTGPLAPDAVRSFLDRSNYFVFLTHWWGEGHSNALTEAMARGCVPVFTLRGFNEAVAGDAGIRVEDRDDSAAIADRIAAHWTSGAWPAAAASARARVVGRFGSARALEIVRGIYAGIGAARG